MNTNFEINLGMEPYVLPSIEGCLRDNDGKFYSTQNAIRVHEWLGGASTDPLILEAVVPDAAGLLKHKQFGQVLIPAYAEKFHPGWVLKIEKHFLAVPEIRKILKTNLSTVESPDTSQELKEAASETVHAVMTLFNEISAFNASCMFFRSPFPKRLVTETLDVLNYLFSCVLTQRRREVFITMQTFPTDLPDQMYKWSELDQVIARMHEAGMVGFFPQPEMQAVLDRFLDASFFKQCAMAFSSLTNTPIPTAYFEEPTKVYFWALKVLTAVRDTVPDMQVRPKLKNVVSIFKK